MATRHATRRHVARHYAGRAERTHHPYWVLRELRRAEALLAQLVGVICEQDRNDLRANSRRMLRRMDRILAAQAAAMDLNR